MSIQGIFERLLSHIEHVFSLRFVFLFGSILAVLTLSVLFYTGVLPLSLEYFLFYSFILFLACLARPSWMFLLLSALLPLEIVSIAPASLGFDLRPYQWVAGLLGLALLVRWLTGRLRFPFFHWHWLDTSIALLVFGILLSGFLNGGATLWQAGIVGSFFFLYCLSRVFLRTWQDVSMAFSFFALSSLGTLLWGIGQNMLFFEGHSIFSVMPGRPNGLLPEPDWLGLLTLFLLGPALLALKNTLGRDVSLKQLGFPFVTLLLVVMTLILTVSRSAWLGALAVGGILLLLSFFRPGKPFQVRPALLWLQSSVIVLGLALLIIEAIPLTRFPLLDRAGSTVSHLQEITIACDGTVAPPKTVAATSDLIVFGCQHILLEEKEIYRDQGKLVTTTTRPDPNVGIRQAIYATVWTEIKSHPIFGIGWGNIGPKLGVDERGASYNASNLFLELWLGGGILSLLAWFLWLGILMVQAWKVWRTEHASPWPGLLIALLAGFLIFNLFNTGLLLGFVWVWLALFPLLFTSPHAESSKA